MFCSFLIGMCIFYLLGSSEDLLDVDRLQALLGEDDEDFLSNVSFRASTPKKKDMAE
jgi:hypothetical protein